MASLLVSCQAWEPRSMQSEFACGDAVRMMEAECGMHHANLMVCSLVFVQLGCDYGHYLVVVGTYRVSCHALMRPSRGRKSFPPRVLVPSVAVLCPRVVCGSGAESIRRQSVSGLEMRCQIPESAAGGELVLRIPRPPSCVVHP